MATVVALAVFLGDRTYAPRNLGSRGISSGHRRHDKDDQYRARRTGLVEVANYRTGVYYLYRQAIEVSHGSGLLRVQVRFSNRFHRFCGLANLSQVKGRRRRVVFLRGSRIAVLYLTEVRRRDQGTN